MPQDYIDFLEYSNGGEGSLLVEPGWFSLWPAEELLISNKDYEVDKYLPGFFGFGSNGGGELLAFDTKEVPYCKVFMIPFGGMEETAAILVANSFLGFIEAIGDDKPTLL